MARLARMGMPASATGGWTTLLVAALLAAEAALAQAPITQTPTTQAPQPHFAPVQPAPQAQQPQVQQQPQAEAPRREGFFDAVGRWWDKSTRDFKAKVDENNAKWKQSVDDTNAKLKAGVDESNAKWRELGRKTEQAAKDAAVAQKEATEDFLKAQKDTAEAIKNLSNLRMVEGRQVCGTAPNGSPDCQAAAEVICKGKGFATGKSADITTSRKCSARALLQRDESECRTESVVIKAACQ
jgi:hypothetical protein